MRKSILTAAAVLALSGLVWAAGRPGVVKTRDGATYDGTVDEQDDKVVVTVHGIDTTVNRDNVVSITYGDFEARWKGDYAKLAPNDVNGRLAAGRRALDERQYDLAEKAANDAKAIDANSAEADQLLKLTQSQRRLSGKAASDADTPARQAESEQAQTTTKLPGVWNTLSADDVNRVKQLDIRDTDTKVRFAFANGVQKKFYDSSPRLAAQYPTYADFARAPRLTQALAIIDQGGPDLARDVKIASDPDVVIAFRKDVLPLVLNGCATSACHGGTDNAATHAFAMAAPASEPAVVYTDFYLLQSTKVKVGSASGKGFGNVVGNTVMPDMAYMMDRTRPDMSLLLQYGLPDQIADLKHPHVRGYNGIFRSRDDAKYRTVLAFLQTLRPVQPDYGIDFHLRRQDTSAAATQPSRP